MDPLILVCVGITIVVGSILVLRLHAFLALFLGALAVAVLTPESNLISYADSVQLGAAETQELLQQSLGRRLADAFGSTCAKIGLLIALASIIGKCLLDSGSAEKIVRQFLAWIGQKHAPLAFLGSGFFLAIPVYFDTVFYLMIPLGKAMGIKDKQNYLFFVLTIVAGTAMAHSLVPPTPGPLFVAGQLKVEIGTMILLGIAVGIFTSMAGYFYAAWANRRWPVPLRETADISMADLEKMSERVDEKLPPLWLAVFPVVLPILLISARTILGLVISPEILQTPFFSYLFELGDSTVALALAAGVSLLILTKYKSAGEDQVKTAVQKALFSAGMIILITAAGGAFGTMLQQTGIGSRVQELAGFNQYAILPLAFFITALIRTAQGSATVAMIAAVGILTAFADPAVLGCHPVYLALVIGCGSKLFPWMNDSGFWIISRMAGLNEKETLKTFSLTLTCMAFAGLIVIMILANVLPLV